MIALYILLAVFLLLFALLLIPLTASVRLVDKKCSISLRIFAVKIRLYPRKKRGKGRVKKKQADTTDKPSAQEQNKSDPAATIELLRTILAGLPRILGALDVPGFRLRMRLASEDPAKTAELYGSVCAAFGLLWNEISNLLRIRHPRIDIEPNFDTDEGEYLLFIDVRTCVLKALVAVIPIAISYLKLKVKQAGGKKK